MRPKIIFAGTPEFAAFALESIILAGFDVCLVLTQPDRPKGRGLKLTASPVKLIAEKHHLPVAQPHNLKDPEIIQTLQALKADIMVVAAYGLLLPQNILTIPQYGCWNIHASLLPRWRGAAPIQRSIEAGDQETGICIMQMDEGLDTGAILSRHSINISPHDTAQHVHDALMKLGADAIVADLQQITTISPTPQDHTLATYAKKISQQDAQINWNLPAEIIDQKIRAFSPVPGAWTLWQGTRLKIWQANIIDAKGNAGTVIHNDHKSLIIACGDRALSIHQLQLSGGKAMGISSFLSGNSIPVGAILSQEEDKP